MSDAKSANRRVLLIGATGLVGRSVIARTAQVPEITLQGLSRREIEFPPGARMELVLAESEDWAGIVQNLAPDALICALGTTRAKAGSEEEFRAVDHDLVMEVAQAARAADVRSFVHISSVGADTASRNFYLRTKGEVERELKALRFTRLDVLRPGLLRGKRAGEIRLAEGLGRVLAPFADLFLRGEASRYRSIHTSDLAAAALQCTAEKAPGQFVHEHDGIRRLIKRFDDAHEAREVAA